MFLCIFCLKYRRAAEKIEPDKRAWTFEQVSKIAAPKNGRTFEIAYAKIAYIDVKIAV